jgi:Tfp pilus assembly protein FimT
MHVLRRAGLHAHAGIPMTRSSTRGGSLAEVLVLLVLLGVLLITAFPQLMVPPQIPAGLAARGVAVDLTLARRLAIAGRANYVVTFTPAAGPYTSYTVSLQGGTPGPDFPKTIQKGVTVTGTPQVITYTPNGAASSGGTLTFTDGAATAQVSLTAATGFVQVTGP